MMMEIQLHVTAERMDACLTWDDLIALEELQDGQPRFRGLRDVVSKFMVNGSGQYLDAERACAELGKLTRAQIVEVARQLNEGMQGASVNPPSGGS